MKRIAIGLQPQVKQVEVLIKPGLLYSEIALQELRRLASKFALLCNEEVAISQGKRWRDHLHKNGVDAALFTFPVGEKEKCRERKAELEDQLFSHGCGRDTCLIGMGGGVTTDLVGYLASTYCRGTPLVLTPSTLVGMVDAAVGGKTGVNTPFGKNLVGTFYPADRILIDPYLLATLPAAELRQGAAEVIKYALIRSPELFQLLRSWQPDDPGYLELIIHESLLIKAQVVESDFEEKSGLRRILNFGHTIAHALELLENYQLPHGDAVAIGMLVESYLSHRMGLLKRSHFEELEELIRSFHFPLKVSSAVTSEKMRASLARDKKSAKGSARFVLIDKIGACHPFHKEYCIAVPDEILNEALTWMFAHCSGDPR
jgi:3-dehydroquinate synthase